MRCRAVCSTMAHEHSTRLVEWRNEWVNEWMNGGVNSDNRSLRRLWDSSSSSLQAELWPSNHVGRALTKYSGLWGMWKKEKLPRGFWVGGIIRVRTEPLGCRTPCIRYICKSEPYWRIPGDAVEFKIWGSLWGKSPCGRCMGAELWRKVGTVVGGICGMR